nr:hypothetical protein [uncultured Cetobacterium sp.]
MSAVVKVVIKEQITKLEKSIERELSLLKEMADDTVTINAVVAMKNSDEPLPSDCPYVSYDEWIEQLQKEAKSTESSLNRIGVEKNEIIAFKYYVDNAPDQGA